MAIKDWTPERVSQHNKEIFLSKRDILRVSDCHFITVTTDPVVANEIFKTNKYPSGYTLLRTDAYLSTSEGEILFEDGMFFFHLLLLAETKEEGLENHEANLKKVRKFLTKEK